MAKVFLIGEEAMGWFQTFMEDRKLVC
uniref:Uncharacterized protein n=1 Tax=Nelumbo nucifera TaxID=4432 RepID=A0A822YK03_NELNU|nr:TPA_asm: hypothetical protein HUJ06_011688 [Nelumbo nucifera]